MSRIGKRPVLVPAGVKVSVAGATVKVEGPKGKLNLDVHPKVVVRQDGNNLVCDRVTDNEEDRESKALHGLTRALVQNMVTGVASGFEKKLEIVGVGFNAVLESKTLTLTVGYANKIKLPVPDGVTVTIPDATHIVVNGADKQKVGHFAAQVRASRKPEPYKGTGIRYQGEQVRKKAGKAFGSGG